MSGEFTNKVAVVTGGSRGIGREIAADLAGAGAQTVIVSSSAAN
ncbi:MAG: SDR family NAD(P)-dependent oxidoreductase, partial [Xanthobacteraceae bacterium]